MLPYHWPQVYIELRRDQILYYIVGIGAFGIMVVVMEELRIVDVDVMTIIIIAVALCVLKWMMIAAVMMLLAAVKMRIVMGLIKVNVFLRQAAA